LNETFAKNGWICEMHVSPWRWKVTERDRLGLASIRAFTILKCTLKLWSVKMWIWFLWLLKRSFVKVIYINLQKQCKFVRMFQQKEASHKGPRSIHFVNLVSVFTINTHWQKHFLFGAKIGITQSIFMSTITNKDTKWIFNLCPRNYAKRPT
jgi:hypothetical protein